MKIAVAMAALMVAVLTGCTKMEQYYPNGQVVEIDGIEFSVSPMGNKAGSYKAMPNNPKDQSFLMLDPMVWVRNTKAIEKATGCSVYRESVKNHENTTFAAVDCSAKPNPA
ncbi:hypothetical protein [Agrobacterium tumefaciens]|uniref:hypothetical protein n=1 Tax=Agrobacterium tumefaciens TaxID=358 RepID=UPI003B9E3845